MRQRGFAVAFIIVLVVALVGGFFGGRYLIQRIRDDFGEQPLAARTPASVAVESGETAEPTAELLPTVTAPSISTPAAPTQAPMPTVPGIVTPDGTAISLLGTTPVATLGGAISETPSFGLVTTPTPGFGSQPTLAPGTGEFGSPDSAASPTATPTEVLLPQPVTSFPFALVRPLRYSSGDCPGNYVLGQVTDRAGNPLSDVRLLLVDEFGNEATTQTKSVTGDSGKYDFPLSGPARRFFLTIVDGGSTSQSQPVEFGFKLAPNETASCFWADWQRR